MQSAPPIRSASKARSATPVSTMAIVERVGRQAAAGEGRRRGGGRGRAARPGCGCDRGRGRSGGRRRGRPRGSAVRAGGSRASRRSGRRGRAAGGGPARGCGPGLPSTSTQAMPRPGNSAATCGATQPCSGAGSQPHPVRRRPGHLSRPPPLGSPPAAARPVRFELGGGEVADAGALQGAAGVDVGEGRAAADPVEAGDGAVAVVADRHRPAAPADQFANACRGRRGRPARGSPPAHGSADRRARPRPAARRSRRPW